MSFRDGFRGDFNAEVFNRGGSSQLYLISLTSGDSILRFIAILSLCSLSRFSLCSSVSVDLRRDEHSLACLSRLSLRSSDSPDSLEDDDTETPLFLKPLGLTGLASSPGLSISPWLLLCSWVTPGWAMAAHSSRKSELKSPSAMIPSVRV